MNHIKSSTEQGEECTEIPEVVATAESLNGIGELFRLRDLDRIECITTSLIDRASGNRIHLSNSFIINTFTIFNEESRVGINRNSVQGNNSSPIISLVDEKNPYRFYINFLYSDPTSTMCIAPSNNDPFIMVIGNTPETVKAYIFSGQEGIKIPPRVWISWPVIHYYGMAEFKIKHSIPEMSMIYKKAFSFSYI